MHLPLLVLLFAGPIIADSVNGTFLKYSDFFTVSENGSKTITDPYQPIISNGREFYWTGFHQSSFDLPVLCEVESSSEEWSLGEVYFANGSQPTGIQFGCPKFGECHGFSCFNRFLHEEFVLGAAMVAMVCPMFAMIGFMWPMLKRANDMVQKKESPPFSSHFSA